MIALVVVLALVVACASETGERVNGVTLGGLRSAWLAKGQPEKRAAGEVFEGNRVVTFAAGSDGDPRATRVELLLGHEFGFDRGGVPVAEARELSKPLQPPDGQPVRKEAAVEVFKSEQLGRSLPKEAFGGEPPGTYAIVADRGTEKTDKVVLAVGSKP